jgi:hypothetical protein
MLTSKVDDDWLVGYLENNVMHQGLFPWSFVEIIVALKEQPNEQPVYTFHSTYSIIQKHALLYICSV